MFRLIEHSVLQTGKMGGEAYRAAGITGKGQVCGIADSGLNDLSCFFYDGPSLLSPSSSSLHTSAYRGVLTNRSGVIEPLRRKVIQYIAYADMTDELGKTALHCTALRTRIRPTMKYKTMLHFIMMSNTIMCLLCYSVSCFNWTASDRLRTIRLYLSI